MALPPYGPDDFKSLIPASNASWCSKLLALPGRLAVYIYRWVSWAVNSDLTATEDLKTWLGLDTTDEISAPTNVTATDGTSSANVTVSWTSVTGASFYKVYRSAGSTFSGATLLGTSTTTSYVDASVTADQVYYFWVVATNSAGDSDESTPDTGYAQSGGANSITITSNSSWTVPSGVSSITIQVWGGGGGGGGRGRPPYGLPGTYYAAGGGGGSEYATGSIAVTSGWSLDVVVGSVGTGGGENVSGTNGSSTTVSRSGTLYISAAGGTGGLSNDLGDGSGGAGGTGGSDGIVTPIDRNAGLPGSSGSGATGGAGGATDPVETGFGTGGAGAGTAASNGSNGSSGKVIISW